MTHTITRRRAIALTAAGTLALAPRTTLVEDGAQAAIPNDVTNGGRALKLFEANGPLTLDAEVDNPSVRDITDNPKNPRSSSWRRHSSRARWRMSTSP